MGNQLVGVAPSQIYPVEHYLSDHVDLSFDQSLGSTRFLKVARARSREGLVVVKVFAVHDPSLPLAEHKERILKIKEQLASAFNCLPFQRVILTDKAGLVMREYCKCSVYDRMSTRPFLTTLEKKWITFQVLYALHRMHKLGICHGDIKLENIMVTSWLWVLLTDIASFKPTFLPDDNPADFSYFFDTSRRRLCYVAPERFVRAPDPHNRPISDDRTGGLLLSESPCKVGELVPSMDIFSAGCALLELWNDGTPALDLPGLLAYRNGEDRPSTMTLPEGSDPQLRALLHSMTERNPRDRRSAELYLDEARGKLFPEYFYSFLQSYMLIFSAQPILPPDEKIVRIHQDIRNIIKIFTQPSDAKNYQDLVEETTDNKTTDNIDTLMKDGFKVVKVKVADFEDEEEAPEKKELGPDSEGLILITSLVTSCIRGLRHCTSKLYTLEILQLLCENSSSETILDRILPYIIHLSHDSVSRVRALGVVTAARCVSLVRALPQSDCNVFPEYVLPELAPRATDPAVPVRIAYAHSIAKLAETAVRFLDQTQNMVDKEAANINYETELSALHEMVRSTVSYLLTDSQAVVKRALVDNGITKLCIFFGKQKANDVILSHMVTFLNDKEEAALRGCFFERVVGVAAYVGHHAAPILLPLLQQGLTDQSEWIIAKALRATSSLAELGLLPKQALCDLVAESAVYLAHPNLWIRHEVCGLVSCVATLLNPIDVNCKMLPLVWPHLKHKLIQVERAELLLESLSEPIPRKVLDGVLRHGDVDRLVHTLRERRNTRLKVKQGTMPQYSEMGTQLRNLFRRLASDGMTEHVENQLLAMSAHLIKINRSSTQHITDAPGKLVLNKASISRSVQLDAGGDALPHQPDKLLHSHQRRTHKTSLSHEAHMNTEWQHMFGHSHDQHQPRASESTSQSMAGMGGLAVTSQAASVAPSHSQMGHSASYVQYSMAPCRAELRNLTARMQQKFHKSLRSHDEGGEGSEDIVPPASWRPGNQLLAYLHEHKARVNQMVTLPAHRNLFGSCSDDGTVRLWDAARLQGHAYVNRSKSMYNRSAGPVGSLAACEGGQSLVAATAEGSIFVLRLDSGSSRMTLSQCRQVEAGGGGEEGGCVALACAGGVHAGVISYATLLAAVVGWDLRAPGTCDQDSCRMTLSQCRQVEAGGGGEEGGCVALACAGGVHAGVISYATLLAAVVGWDLRAPGTCDQDSCRMTLSQCRQVEAGGGGEEGGCVALACAGGVHAGVISYATLLAAVVGWDLRAPGTCDQDSCRMTLSQCRQVEAGGGGEEGGCVALACAGGVHAGVISYATLLAAVVGWDLRAPGTCDQDSCRMTLSQCRQVEAGGGGEEGGCVALACAGGVHAGVISYATLLAAVVGWDLRAPGTCDQDSCRMTLSQCRQVEAGGGGEEGGCVALACAGGVHAGVISYATLLAAVVGWDLRAPGNAWKLKGDLKQGVYTCMYANSAGYIAVGTSSGAICVWDLRFQLPITSVRHPNSERVRRIVGWGGCGSRVWALGCRDAGAWCLESTQRTHALWPCTNSPQPLHYTPSASHYISAAYCGSREGSRFLVTGGSDQRLRHWDLEHPEDSYVLLHAPADQLKHSPNAVKYRSRIIDGTTVIQECCKVNPSSPPPPADDNVYRSVESRSFYHAAPITDLTMVEGPKHYLVSSSADGVINVWK